LKWLALSSAVLLAAQGKNAKGVPLGSNIQVQFDEPMAQSGAYRGRLGDPDRSLLTYGSRGLIMNVS
jgi:hypothetical protein